MRAPWIITIINIMTLFSMSYGWILRHTALHLVTTKRLLQESSYSRGGIELNMMKDKQQKGQSEVHLMKQLLRLLRPGGDGQTYGTQRNQMHQTRQCRRINDVQLWTHTFFVFAAAVAYHQQVLDLFLLLFIVTPLSFIYHLRYERPGKLAVLEGFFAKLLFAYGVGQIVKGPDLSIASTVALKMILSVEIVLMLCTVFIFFITNLQPHLYDPWHCLMHVIPALWATIVAAKHEPLFQIAITLI